VIATIYQTLTSECQSVKRWYQFGNPAIGTAQKPLGVIELGATRRLAGNRLAASQEVICAVYFAGASWPTIQAAADEVRRLLAGIEASPRVLEAADGKRFTLQYVGTSSGFYDDAIQAWGMRVTFTAPVVL